MMDERKEEAASLYALDLLEGAELAAFELELKKDAALRKLVDELRQASSQLALTASAQAPSEALRSRVLASIAATPQPKGPSLVSSNAAESNKVVAFPISWVAWAAAACFALTSGYLATNYFSLRTETIALRNDLEITRVETQTLRQKLDAEEIVTAKQIADFQRDHAAADQQIADLRREGDLAQLKIARLASLIDSKEAAAIAVWNPMTREGLLTVEKLPILASDQDYQLWVVDPKKPNPVSGGVFSVDEKGGARIAIHTDQKVDTATVFAVTRERKGGVSKAQGPAILKGDL